MPAKRKFGPRYKVPFRRRREGKTDYRARYRMLLSQRIRAVVRKSRRNIIIQFVKAELKGDKTLSTTRSLELRKFGWNFSGGNIPAAYLTGYLAGLKALKAGINEAILDIGPQRSTRGGRLYAALKGMIDAGLDIPYSENVLPSLNRIQGQHIASYAEKLMNEDIELYNKRFSRYIRDGLDPTNIVSVFMTVLSNIAKEFNVESPSFEEESEEGFEEE